MPLPKIEHPIHEVYLKSLNKTVRYRPFLVKEEKLLLMAKEADELKTISDTIKQVIRNCCLDDIDVDSLPTFDVEMFFVHLRMNSIGESSQMVYTCSNVIEEKSCEHKTIFDLQLKNIKYRESEGHSALIKLNDKIGLKFKYPSISIPQSVLNNQNSDSEYSLIIEYLEYIYDQDQIYEKKDLSKEELNAFFDELTLDQVQNIKNFFLTVPSVVLEQEVVCSQCGYKANINVEGILSFFD